MSILKPVSREPGQAAQYPPEPALIARFLRIPFDTVTCPHPTTPVAESLRDQDEGCFAFGSRLTSITAVSSVLVHWGYRDVSSAANVVARAAPGGPGVRTGGPRNHHGRGDRRGQGRDSRRRNNRPQHRHGHRA